MRVRNSDASSEKINYRKLCTEASGALIADAGTYWIHTLWTIQQESSARKPLSFYETCHQLKKNGNSLGELYRGFSISAFAAVVGIFPYLKGADFAIQSFGNNHLGQIMQGPFAHAFASVIWVPANRLVELEQASVFNANHNVFKQLSLVGKAKAIWKEDGMRGFYRGMFPNFCINSMNDALGFWLRARMLLYFSIDQRNQVIPQLFCTLLGFGFAYGVTTPLSVIQTRIRIHETNPTVFMDKTFLRAARTLYFQHGFRGFFHGTLASILYGVGSSIPVACNGVFKEQHYLK